MADLINIDTHEASKKLKVLNNNFMLVIVICFALSIAFLYQQQQKLSDKLVEYLMNDVRNNTKIIEQNSIMIDNNNKLLEYLKTIEEKKN